MFSVIIPLYNKERSVKNTIQSVLNQTFSEFEIIIVNDGSTDSSLDVVKNFKDERIRIIDKLNGGVSSARNRGIKEAKYEWTAFLDGDDMWLEDHLTQINGAINSNPFCMVLSSSYCHNLQDNRGEDTVEVWTNYFKEALRNRVICSSTVVINKKCFDEVGVFNEGLNKGEDIDLWIRIGRKFDIVKLNRITAIYRLEAENRAGNLRLDYDRSIVSKLSFRDVKSKDEEKYIRKIILERFKILLKSFNIIPVYKIVRRYGIHLLR